VRFECLTGLNISVLVFWVVTPCECALILNGARDANSLSDCSQIKKDVSEITRSAVFEKLQPLRS
jgi:hypothetical protein